MERGGGRKVRIIVGFGVRFTGDSKKKGISGFSGSSVEGLELSFDFGLGFDISHFIHSFSPFLGEGTDFFASVEGFEGFREHDVWHYPK